MKKLIAVPVILCFVLSGCLKNNNRCDYTDSTIVAPAAEQNALKDSLDAHGITATLNPSGFYYRINSQGNGKFITNLCTLVSVEYKGGFFNGKVFDSTATGKVANFQLGQVIPGWQKGMPLISQGGSITLYIPPSLAYGPNDLKDAYGNVVKDANGNTLIPGNSYLVFNVNLLGVQ